MTNIQIYLTERKIKDLGRIGLSIQKLFKLEEIDGLKIESKESITAYGNLSPEREIKYSLRYISKGDLKFQIREFSQSHVDKL